MVFPVQPSEEEVLLQALSHQDPAVRRRAATAVLSVPPQQAEAVPRVAAAMRRQLRVEPVADVRAQQVRFVGWAGASPLLSGAEADEALLATTAAAAVAAPDADDADVDHGEPSEAAGGGGGGVAWVQALEALRRAKRLPAADAGTWLPPLLRLLTRPKPAQRAAPLPLLALLLPPRQLTPVLYTALADPHPSVRLVAARELAAAIAPAALELAELYPRVATLLTDVEAAVRAEATKLLWLLALVYPDELAPAVGAAAGAGAGAAAAVRQVDECFVRLCGMMGDTDRAVRQLACHLLGSLPGAHQSLLLQTFSKQLLPYAAPSRPALPAGSAASAGSGGAASSTFWSMLESAEVGGVAAGDGAATAGEGADWEAGEEVSLLDAGAAGAFVHGLEDEYLEVRGAAIDSVCELAVRRPAAFGPRAVEALVDMLNDEIDAVRLNALHSLRKLAAAAPAATGLSTEQLHVVLALVDDAAPAVRHATHRLLAVLRLAHLGALHAALHALLANLAKRPAADTDSVLGALAAMGRTHAALAEFLVEQELRLDRRFLLQEASPEDTAYVALLVFFASAAAANPTLFQLLPAFALRHYAYLKEKFPRYMPDLALLRQQQPAALAPATPASASLAAKAAGAAACNAVRARLAEVDAALAGPAPRPAHHLRALLAAAAREAREAERAGGGPGVGWAAFAALAAGELVGALLDEELGAAATAGAGAASTLAALTGPVQHQQRQQQRAQAAASLLAATYRLQEGFIGLDAALRAWLLHWRLYAHLVLLRASAASSGPSSASMPATPSFALARPGSSAAEQLVEMASVAARHLAEHDLAPSPPLAALLQHLTPPSATRAAPLSADQLLALPAVAHFRPPAALPASVRAVVRTRATLQLSVLAPAGAEATSPDRPAALSAGGAGAREVVLAGEVQALGSGADGLALGVEGYQPLPLPASALRPHGPLLHALAASVLLALPGPWTEPAPLRLVLLKRFRPDLAAHPYCWQPISPVRLLYVHPR